jgi:hypothetical protein
MSRDDYSESPALTAEFMPAHSGPELASCVPDPKLAQELARTLLSDSFELTHSNHAMSSSYAGFGGSFTIGLVRR